jgi:hypothetical protein
MGLDLNSFLCVKCAIQGGLVVVGLNFLGLTSVPLLSTQSAMIVGAVMGAGMLAEPISSKITGMMTASVPAPTSS